MTSIDNIYIGRGFAAKLAELTMGRNVIFITDENLAKIYSDFFTDKRYFTIGLGEINKTLATVGSIHSRLLELGADRHTFIVGFGGGIVTDVVGFAAATYMRGVDFGFVATTVVAQSDASVGGKNGVNVGGYKNIAGVFKKPQFVICDPAFFETLPDAELTAAYGEIIKCAIIADPELLQITDLEQIVIRCVKIKSDIVAEDFTEQGRRKLLNLGHTFGHSLEKCSGGTRYLHGQAVAIGICVAARISHHLGLLPKKDMDFIETVIKNHGLHTRCPADIPPADLIENAMADKKQTATGVDMILIKGVGEPVIVNITREQMFAFEPYCLL